MKWRQFFKESGRVVTVFLLLVITFCFAMFQGGFVSWFVFFTVVPFLLYAILLAFVPIHIEEIERKMTPKRLSRGDRVRVDVTFRVRSKLPLLFMSVSELPMDKAFYEGARGHSTKLFVVGFKRQFRWSYELYDLQRGEYDFAGLVVVFTDFFGWTVRKKIAHKRDAFLVYPKTEPLKLQAIRAEYEQGAMPSPFSLMKDTSVVTGVRDYQPGDRFSWVHWKSFAKNGELRTKEFEDKQAQTIFVVLDLEPSEQTERTIDFTASLLQSMIGGRADVSFLSIGKTRFYSPLMKTDVQLQKVLAHLAVVQADAPFSVDRILQTESELMKRAVVVVVTGEKNEKLTQMMKRDTQSMSKILCYIMTETEHAQQQFGRHHVVFVHPNTEVNS